MAELDTLILAIKTSIMTGYSLISAHANGSVSLLGTETSLADYKQQSLSSLRNASFC